MHDARCRKFPPGLSPPAEAAQQRDNRRFQCSAETEPEVKAAEEEGSL